MVRHEENVRPNNSRREERKKEAGIGREREREEGAREGGRDVVTSFVTSATRSTLTTAMHSWKNGVRVGQSGHTNAGRRKKRPATRRGGGRCSNVEKGCGGRARAERVNGGKEREVQKGRGRSRGQSEREGGRKERQTG